MSDPGDIEGASGDQGPAGFVYRFAGFELDPVRETLHGTDGPVLLRDHALRVLMLLIERAPEVVSRDEILESVWGHQALSESSIAQVIRDIRSALGDPARSPELVATRYGRGYQFVGNVTREPRAPEMPPHSSPNATTAQPDRQGPRRAGVRHTLLFIVGLTIVALGWQWLRTDSSMPVAAARDSITLRAIEADGGESLSAPFVDYLAFVLNNALGADRIEVAGDESEVESAARVVEISLASLESGDRRNLELAVGRAAVDDPALRKRFDEASDLVRRSLDEILATLQRQADPELRFDAALISQSSFAIETLLRGMAAQLAGDVTRAAELFEAALAEDPDFEFARYELAIALRRNGKYERSLAILEPMADRLNSEFWRHRINNAMGIAYWRLNQYDDALGALRRAEASADAPASKAVALMNIALIERNQGRLEQAEATVLRAIALAEQAEVPRLQASSRNTLASIQLRLGRAEQALGNLEIARELFYETGNLAGYSAVLSRTARVRAARGERAETESLLRLALGIREQIGDQLGIADIEIRLARIYRVQGEFDQARVLARSGLDRAQPLEDDALVIDAHQSLASLALADKRYDQARSYGDEALRLARQTGRENDQRAVRHGLLALDLATEARSLAEIESSLARLIEDADAAKDRTVGVRARLLISEVHRRQQRPDDARRMLDRADALLEADNLRLRKELDAERARLALMRDDVESAARALEALERNSAPPHPTLMLRARLQAAQGDLKSAVETAGLARLTIGDWWRPEDQAILDAWSAELRR